MISSAVLVSLVLCAAVAQQPPPPPPPPHQISNPVSPEDSFAAMGAVLIAVLDNAAQPVQPVQPVGANLEDNAAQPIDTALVCDEVTLTLLLY